jgi:hypothetical protein
MVTVYVVATNRDLTSEEIDEALELRKEVLHYGKPNLRQTTGPGRIHLSGEIHKLSTKTEADAQVLGEALQARFGCDFEISQQDCEGQGITWEDDKTS